MLTYLLGLITLPALAGLFVLACGAWRQLAAFADRHGYSVETMWARNVDDISEYTLRNDIWFERSRGPIFTGHWCRTSKRRLLATRWLGIGSTRGPCVIFYKRRDLGPVSE